MKILLTLFVLLFSSSVVAEDISDFQIEGMSIGDSALDFFSKKQIKNNTWDYPNEKFMRVQNDQLPFFKTYDAVDFHYRTEDPNYIIQNVSGVIFYEDNFDQCNNKMDAIVKELSILFDNSKQSEKSFNKLMNDKSGKSKYSEVYFELNDGYVLVTCYDYSLDYGGQDHLDVAIDTSEFNEWLTYEAY